MRRLAFPLAALATLALAALLVWLWASDYLAIDRCNDAGGTWDAAARTCRLALTPIRP